MQTLTANSLQTKTHPQTKMMFWFLFSSSRGAPTRVRIVKLLRDQPCNAHQISKELAMDYKAIKHHLAILEKNNIIGKFEASYGASYYLSELFEQNQVVFDEILSKLKL